MEFPAERTGHAAPTELAERRAALRQALCVPDAAVSAESPTAESSIAGVRVARFRPTSQPKATLLHMHGGGFRQGCPEMLGPFARELAQACCVEVICPAYRLAPEHPFPAGLSDCWRVLSTLLGEAELPVILSGDSAGGGLAAGLAGLSVARGSAAKGLVLLSPWLDLTVTSNSYAQNAASDPVFSREAALEASRAYLQGADPCHPLASPNHGDVSRFPATFIACGSGEVLADDSRSLAAALRDAAVPFHLLELPGMEHVAVTRSRKLPGAAQCFQALTGFIDGLTGAG